VQVLELTAQQQQQQQAAERQRVTTIHQLMDETNNQLSRMQADYDHLLHTTASIIVIQCCRINAY